MIKILSILTISIAIVTPLGVRAKEGDTVHVVTHSSSLTVTDPSNGYNDYPVMAAFPAESEEYRKVSLWITYACPDGLHCGQWDYLDHIFLCTTDSLTGATHNIELARMISPYGWSFDSTWQFTWRTDISDFSSLLHDSVEIVFRHGGYENSEDRGWLITLDFEIIPGRSPAKLLGMDTLWCGRFDYGDSSKPIENLLMPITISHPEADFARLRIVQTGHGMDDSANCAEFCEKWRRVIFDDSVVDQRPIWKECGDNPLYPQAGTWIFDRAGWCPGDVVDPDVYDFPLEKSKEHTVDIDMEPYINSSKPTANYWIYAYIFYYEEPWAEYDISIEEVIIPSTLDEHSRLNPSCDEIRVRVRNTGNETIGGVDFTQIAEPHNPYSSMLDRYTWKGKLLPLQDTTIGVPSTQFALLTLGSCLFPNSQPIEPQISVGISSELSSMTKASTSASFTFPTLPIHTGKIILTYRTNSQSGENCFSIRPPDYRLDRQTFEIFEKRSTAPVHISGSLAPITVYYDTLDLIPGCYNLVVTDTAGDGLSFWFNPEGGHGYVRLLDMEGRLIKDFNPDFGNSINYWFEVDDERATRSEKTALVDVFPPRNDGKFDLFLFCNTPTDTEVEVVNDSTSAVVYTAEYPAVKDTIVNIDLVEATNGRYHVKVKMGDELIERRIRVNKGN